MPPQLVHRQLPIADGLLQPRPTQKDSIYHVCLFAFWKQSTRIPTAPQLSMRSILGKNSSPTNSRGRTPPHTLTLMDGANVLIAPERASAQRIDTENLQPPLVATASLGGNKSCTTIWHFAEAGAALPGNPKTVTSAGKFKLVQG